MDATGLVFDIQRYCLHDGPGIRTVVFLKGCPLACAWCANPESQAHSSELMVTANRCIACGECLQSCEAAAISIDETSSRPTPVIDRTRCTVCLQCCEVCVTGSLKQVGQRLSSSEVLGAIERDLPFFGASDGGVTLSGGEPLLQAEFTRELLSECKQRGIHTAVETSGFVPKAALDEVLPFCDLLLYDLKHLDSRAHQRETGAPNDRILRNLEHALINGAELVLRIPLIPGFNDDREHLERLAQFLRKLNPEPIIEPIPHHRLGCFKYERLGRLAACDRFAEYEPQDLRLRRRWLEMAGAQLAAEA